MSKIKKEFSLEDLGVDETKVYNSLPLKKYKFHRNLCIDEDIFLKIKHNKHWLKFEKFYSYSIINGFIKLNIFYSDLSLDELLNKNSIFEIES